MNPIMTSYAYMRTILGLRMARLRGAHAAQDLGASAVELAVITAVILGIAMALLLVIKTFVKSQSDTINGGGG